MLNQPLDLEHFMGEKRPVSGSWKVLFFSYLRPYQGQTTFSIQILDFSTAKCKQVKGEEGEGGNFERSD